MREPVTTHLRASGSPRYSTQKRLLVPLERSRHRSLEYLARYDDRLRDRPSLRGFGPGEVAVIEQVARKEDQLELSVAGEAGDERRGKVVVRLSAAASTPEAYLARLWQVLLPAPPWPSESEESQAVASVIHQMEVWRLSEWLDLPPEEVVARVADAFSEPAELDSSEREALRDCYIQVYTGLSDRARIALLEITPVEEYGETMLLARARPHLPILGDWPSDAVRAEATFDWTTAKVVRSFPRRCPALDVERYRVVVDYDYRARDVWGRDRLVSLLPAAEVRDYAALKITTRQLAGRSEHELNGLPLSLGEKR